MKKQPPVFKEWTKSGRLAQQNSSLGLFETLLVKTHLDKTKTSSEVSPDNTTASSMNVGDSFSVSEQNFGQLNPVANNILNNHDSEITDNEYDKRLTSNPMSCSSGLFSANNGTQTQTVDIGSTLNEYEGYEVLCDRFTLLSVGSSSSNPRTETQTEIDQTVSFFDQLSMLPSIHEAYVEPHGTESSVSGETRTKKARINRNERLN